MSINVMICFSITGAQNEFLTDFTWCRSCCNLVKCSYTSICILCNILQPFTILELLVVKFNWKK